MTPGPPVRADALSRVLDAARSSGGATIVIAGPAGAGKTWLARQALAALSAEHRLVGEGKFGEGDGPGTLAPIMAALSTLVTCALNTLYDGQTGLASLTEALGVELDVLISAGLSVPGVTGTSMLKALDDRRRGMARITAAVFSLLRWSERFGAGRALLIDDWGRASAIARGLVEAIASAPALQPLALLLTQREPATAVFATITQHLGSLDRAEVANLLAERLGDADKADLVLDVLDGAKVDLPFDVLQAADAFAGSGAFRKGGKRWVLDPVETGKLAFDATARVAALTPDAGRLATALGLWGDAAPIAALRTALTGGEDKSAFSAALSRLESLGIVSTENGVVAFRHDRFRQAALDMVPMQRRADLAAVMAERLLDAGAGAETEAAALRLRLAGGMEDACADRWRDRLARGAATARGRGDAEAAGRFAEAAVSLRARRPARDHHTERLILREAVLAAADRDDPALRARVAELVASARTDAERTESYETAIVAMRLGDHAAAAWEVACEGLRSVGIRPPPDRPWLAFPAAALRWWWSRWRDRPDTPGDADAPMDGFTGVATNAATLAYHRDPRAAAIVGFRASLIAGRASRRSAFWQSVDGFLFAALGARQRAADAGERALEGIASQRVWRAMTLYQAIFFCVQWRRPLKAMRDRYPEITRIALIEGDLITACYSLRIFVMSGWRTTDSLDALRDEAIAARHSLQGLGEASFVDEMTAMVALLDGLTGRAEWDPAVWRDDIPTRNHVIDLELSNLAGEWPETLRRAATLQSVRRDYDVQADAVVLRFHENLARLRCGLRARRADMRFIRRAARLNPADHRPKLLLLLAEQQRLRAPGRPATLVAYAEATAAAARSDSRLDQALAARSAAAFAASIGQDDIAGRYRASANAICARWGIRAEIGTMLSQPTRPDALHEAEARVSAAIRSDQAKTRLLAHVGHELRTPLQAMQALLDLSAREGGTVAVDDIRGVLGSLRSVVDDLAIAGRLGSEEATAGVVSTDLPALLRSEIAAWQAEAELSLTIAKTAVPVTIAADRVRQIVRNLLSNAVKYGGGSPIVVELAMVEDADLVDVGITVRDSGPGLAADDIDRLFEPLERGRFDGDGRGQGLGLAIARRIADRLDGTLTARNGPVRGASFTLRFTAPRSVAPRHVRAPRPAHILLVEDSAFIRSLLRALLERQGHNVVEAADAARGLAAWRADAFDLAIIDIGLPDASGLSVRATIRDAADQRRGLPIILLTATSGNIDARARQDPAVRILRKPASAEALSEAMASLLHQMPPASSCSSRPDDLDELYGAARAAVIEQAGLCLRRPQDPAELHQLAGLAAQFGWGEMALAVETLETAVTARAPVDEPRARIRAAIAAMR